MNTSAAARTVAFVVLLASASPVIAALPSDSGVAEMRLLTPLSSVSSRRGSEFRSVVIAPLEIAGRIMLPPGTLVFGSILKRKTVGIGLIHERAKLSLLFNEYRLPDGQRFPLRGRLLRIDNAREYVNSKGEIQGILAADSPQVVLGGMWVRPDLSLFQKSFVGLTGLTGRLWTSYSMGPIGAAALFAAHCVIFRMPEPEIQLPAGAELKVVVSGFQANAPIFEPSVPAELPDELAGFLGTQPYHVEKVNGHQVGDIINIAFQGSRDDLVNAFRAAGWQIAAPLSARSASHIIAAFTGKNGYAGAPASRLIYEGKEPDFVFEKSLNNILKRHHVRVWQASFEGRPLWLGAATHDIGVGFDSHNMMFAHRIQAHIDAERTKIINDLVFTGCSEPAGYVDRDGASDSTVGAGIITDGRLALLKMRGCGLAVESASIDQSKPTRNLPEQVIRRMLLEGRQYVLRENPVYWSYRAFRWTRAAYRPSADVAEE